MIGNWLMTNLWSQLCLQEKLSLEFNLLKQCKGGEAGRHSPLYVSNASFLTNTLYNISSKSFGTYIL